MEIPQQMWVQTKDYNSLQLPGQYLATWTLSKCTVNSQWDVLKILLAKRIYIHMVNYDIKKWNT